MTEPGDQTGTGPGALVRLAELEIDPAQLDAYLRHMRDEIAASVAIEPGVLSLTAVALADSPTSIRILEIYADDAAYRAHLASPHFLAYKAATAGMVLALRLTDVTAVAMAAKP